MRYIINADNEMSILTAENSEASHTIRCTTLLGVLHLTIDIETVILQLANKNVLTYK